MRVEAVQKCLSQLCEAAGSVDAWARDNKLTTAYVYMVLNGSRSPGQIILDALGLEKATIYRKKNGGGK